MDVVVAADGLAVGERAAALVVGALAADESLVLGVATGSTPLPAYDCLAAARSTGVDFSGISLVALDDYVGLPPAHPAGYRSYLQRLLAVPLRVAPDRVVVPDESLGLERRIAELGGVELQMLGIGRNGHLAFNEPGSPLDSRTRVVTLSATTRADNARFFESPDLVPTLAVTQGLATIGEARHLVLLATGDSKAAAVAAALEGPVTPDCPASVVQRHPHVTVLLDRAAASGLRRSVPA